MNKKAISIFLIICMISVAFTSISFANETSIESTDDNTNTDVTADNDAENTATSDVSDTTQTTETDNSTNENETNGTEEKMHNDVIVPTNIDNYNKFKVLLNVFTAEDLTNLADELSAVDAVKYAEVINVLKNDDREHILTALRDLDQKDIDQFFDIFIKFSGDEPNTNKVNEIAKDTSNTASQAKNANEGTKVVNTQQKNYPSVNKHDYASGTYVYKGNSYTVYGFITHLINLYESGKISLDEFLNTLKEFDIDTSKIEVNEDGSLNWGYLLIGAPESNTPVDDTNSTTDTVNTDETNAVENIQTENTNDNTAADTSSADSSSESASNTTA